MSPGRLSAAAFALILIGSQPLPAQDAAATATPGSAASRSGASAAPRALTPTELVDKRLFEQEAVEAPKSVEGLAPEAEIVPLDVTMLRVKLKDAVSGPPPSYRREDLEGLAPEVIAERLRSEGEVESMGNFRRIFPVGQVSRAAITKSDDPRQIVTRQQVVREGTEATSQSVAEVASKLEGEFRALPVETDHTIYYETKVHFSEPVQKELTDGGSVMMTQRSSFRMQGQIPYGLGEAPGQIVSRVYQKSGYEGPEMYYVIIGIKKPMDVATYKVAVQEMATPAAGEGASADPTPAVEKP